MLFIGLLKILTIMAILLSRLIDFILRDFGQKSKFLLNHTVNLSIQVVEKYISHG